MHNKIDMIGRVGLLVLLGALLASGSSLAVDQTPQVIDQDTTLELDLTRFQYNYYKCFNILQGRYLTISTKQPAWDIQVGLALSAPYGEAQYQCSVAGAGSRSGTLRDGGGTSYFFAPSGKRIMNIYNKAVSGNYFVCIQATYHQ